MLRLLTAATEAELTPEAQAEMEAMLQQESESNSGMMLGFILLAGLACLGFGIFLLTARHDTLKKNAFLNGGRHRKGGALIIYRFTGVQMLVLGVLMLAAGLLLFLDLVLPALIVLIVVVIIPFACSSYMKRSKRFQ